MRYNPTYKQDNSNLDALQSSIRRHLVNYMEIKNWNRKALAWHLGIAEAELNKLFNTDNNYTLRRLLFIANKTNANLVVCFEPIQSKL